MVDILDYEDTRELNHIRQMVKDQDETIRAMRAGFRVVAEGLAFIRGAIGMLHPDIEARFDKLIYMAEFYMVSPEERYRQQLQQPHQREQLQDQEQQDQNQTQEQEQDGRDGGHVDEDQDLEDLKDLLEL